MEDFDRLVKNTMENGTEEIPAGLWEAVQNRIPTSAGRSRVIPVWFWSAGAGLAAAAAVTLAVVFSGNRIPESPVEMVSGGNVSLAESVEEAVDVQAPVETESFVPSAVRSSSTFDMSAVREASVPAPADITETPEQIQEEAPAAFSGDGAGDGTSACEPVTEAANQETTPDNYTDDLPESEKNAASQPTTQGDPFEAMDRADRVSAGRKRGLDLTVFGDAVSNTNPNAKGTAGPMRVASAMPIQTSITETGESSFMIPLTFGTGVKYCLSRRWSVGIGFDVTCLQRTYAGTYREIDGDGIEVRAESFSDIKNRQYYIGIPANAYFSIISNNFVDFYAYGGAAMEKCISNKHYMKTATDDITYKQKTGGVLFNAGAGLGCEFLIGQVVGIYIDPSVRYYFKGNAPKSIRTKQPLMVGVEAGIRVRLASDSK